jgi:protein FAM50
MLSKLSSKLEKEREEKHQDFLTSTNELVKGLVAPAVKSLSDKFEQSPTTTTTSIPNLIQTSKETQAIRVETVNGEISSSLSSSSSTTTTSSSSSSSSLSSSSSTTTTSSSSSSSSSSTTSSVMNVLKPKTSLKRPLGLTFSLDDDEEEGDDSNNNTTSLKNNTRQEKIVQQPSRFKDIKRLGKDPSVRTDFLPDAQRTEKEEKERSRLKAEWLQLQEKKKNEEIEIVYSYWDGSGHRRSVIIKKGLSIGRFLDAVRDQLKESFPELRGISSDSLLYVKEDVIIPHTISFYDLIEAKARGKSGPLFQFDVHDDIRLVNDVRIEKDESHPGKVVERRWYEKNKHVFPASRWEQYEPGKVYETYTIKG